MEKKELIEALKGYDKTTIPMHMPGHKRNLKISENFTYLEELSANIDITEVEGFDDLHKAQGILKVKMAEAAEFWGSKEARFLINGSTCGILAGIYGSTKPGDKVLVARNSHKSIYNSIQLFDLEPIFLLPKKDQESGILGSISPKEVEEQLNLHKDIKLIIIGSPTYEGVISDISTISEIAHKREIPLLVDEAHGAHLGHFNHFPKNAVQCGADLVIESVHKTLPSLTQTAILHINGELIDSKRIDFALSIFESSSPSYILLSSIDSCVQLLRQEGERLLNRWTDALDCFERKMKALEKFKIVGRNPRKEKNFFAYDRSKIVIHRGISSLTGVEIGELLLNKYRIEMEMCSMDYAIALTGMGDRKETIDALAEAVLDIDKSCKTSGKNLEPLNQYLLPERKRTIKEALNGETEKILKELSANRICGEYLWAYPPGIPLITPGELITEEMITLFQEYEEKGISLRSSVSEGQEEICVLKEL